MGLLDRIKETAQQGIDKGQAKVNEHQAKSATTDLLRNLGLVAFQQRTGQGDAAHLEELADALVQRLETQIQTNGPLPEPEIPGASGDAASAPAPAPAPPSDPTAGGGPTPGFSPTPGFVPPEAPSGGFQPQSMP